MLRSCRGRKGAHDRRDRRGDRRRRAGRAEAGRAGLRRPRALPDASQLVKGNLVQVAGTPVGKVQDISLTDDGQAEVTMKIDDDAYARCAAGTKAIVRQASLSGVANRYVDLQLPPGTAPRRSTTAASIARATRRPPSTSTSSSTPSTPRRARRCSGVIRGFGTTLRGPRRAGQRRARLPQPVARRVRAASSASSTTTSRCSQRFIVATLEARHRRRRAPRRPRRPGRPPQRRRPAPSAARSDALADAIAQLPAFMRRANTTFVNLRATLDDLDAAGRRVQAGRARSCGRSSPSCARWPATPARRCATSRALIRRRGATTTSSS